MNPDPILAELWEAKDRLAARFDYDIDAIFRYLKEQEAKSGLRYVECPPRKLSATGDDPADRRADDD